MRSTLDLAAMRAIVSAILTDDEVDIVLTPQLDQGLLLALEEYTRASLHPRASVLANEISTVLTPDAGVRDVDLSALTSLIAVREIWYPYDAADVGEPSVLKGRLFWNAGAPTFFIQGGAIPDGSQEARVFYRAPHTLADLDSATETTFEKSDERLIALGAAGHACLMAAANQNEATATAEVQTPNYGDLGVTLLDQFRRGLAPRRIASMG